jgi:FkbM family methyltransferase
MNQKKTTSKQADLIYDVGLHQGQDTDYYLKKGYRVVAFEANPENAEFCRERFAKAISEGRLIIVEGAITDKTSASNPSPKTRFYRNINSSLWGSTCEEWAFRNEVMGTTNEIIEVDVVDLAECLEKYGIPFYLKADIVGSETLCLKALLDFENKPDYISIRSEKVIFNKLLEEFRLLQELGYDQFKAIQQDVTDWQVPLHSNNGNGNGNVYTFQEGASGPFGEETKGIWKNYEQVLQEYRRIFVYYWLFGDYSYLVQTEKGKKFITQLERVFRRPLPGWYDTHAKHSASILTILTTLLTTPSLL